MRYDDLLNAPYKHGGRGKDGFDCYGLVMECCRRNGTPLRDFFKDIESLDADDVEGYVRRGLNVRKTDAPRPGCVVEMEYRGKAHVGFLAERGVIVHATFDRGVRTTHPACAKITAYYEVTQ